MPLLTLTLTARQWATIDADMDNAAQHAIGTYTDGTPATDIRQAGWDQVPWVGPERAWPPMDQPIAIALHRQQWDLVLAELDDSEISYARLGTEQESLDLVRDARAAVREQIPEAVNRGHM